MKKYISVIASCLFFTMLFFSCNDEEFFELERPPENPWLTPSEYERAAVTPYNYAFYETWDGGWYFNDAVMLDIVSDIVYRIPGASADYPIDEYYNRLTNLETDRNNSSFNQGYNGIAICNAALNFYYDAEGDPFPDAMANEKKSVDRIAGELHFMRAFAYFNHTIRNCPVPGDEQFNSAELLPYRINVNNIDDALNAQFVATDSIYSQIIKDLKKAKKLLPKQYKEIFHPSYQYGRATKYAAHALLMRVYFRLHEYELAMSEADTIIEMNGGQFSMDPDPLEAFNRSDASMSEEVIFWALYYDEAHDITPKGFTLFTFLDYRSENGGHGENFKRGFWHSFCMSHAVAKQINWMDENFNETEDALNDKRYIQLYHRMEGYNDDATLDPEFYEQKYPTLTSPRLWCDKYYRAPMGKYGNVPVIRLAEIYLTRSILRYKAGNPEGAAADLNVIRSRAWNMANAGMPYAGSPAYVTSSNITEQMIHNERLKELMFEGDRIRYLQALEMDIPAGDRDASEVVQYPYSDLYWPLPQGELDFITD